MSYRNTSRFSFNSAALFTAAAGTLLIGAAIAASDGESFTSPDLAAKALLSAAESNDAASLLKILGPSAKDILTTSDPVADNRVRAAFTRKAKQRMLVVSDPYQPGQKILEIGNDKWPFPIPLVQTDGNWQFDVDQGKEAILLRRIGNNEIDAIDLCRGYVEAQNEYFEQDRTGKGVRQYAQQFISSPGQHDGLYWQSTDPKDQSPIAEMIAKAIAEGYTTRNQPFHGYRFKILKGQGPQAPGGAMSYLENNAMTHGFALIAWPAEYRSTGVMTFLVDRAGIVYQKDLGAKTAQLANATMVYNPDQTWTPVSGSGVPGKISQNRSRVAR
jgi:hypothetical protein